MHRILVDEKRWMGEDRFLHALNYCMLLPGPEAQQLATYAGWLMHGTRGGLAAGILFVIPGFIAIMAFSIVYVILGHHPIVAGIFIGLKAAVVALVIQALLRIGQRALRNGVTLAVAVGAFIAIALIRAPFPIIVIAAAALGYLWTRAGRNEFHTAAAGHATVAGASAIALLDRPSALAVTPSWRHATKVLAIGLPLWLAPVGAAAFWIGHDDVLTRLGVFFSKMAVVTFGGAYAILTYVAQQAVEHYGWVTPSQMLDGLGLAESTPGPLIMVVQFVGFLAAYQAPGMNAPLIAGIVAACLTVWVTFVPSFIWIFMGAPYVESLRQHQALSGALAAITAAVVGVIASLALWFTLHALFAQVATHAIFGAVRIDAPDPYSVQWTPVLLTGIALLMIFGLKWNIARTLPVCAAIGIIVSLIGSHY
jgi:chromate transporter